MARRGGWRREGRKGRFRYLDSRGKRITDPEKIARIEELAIPPAWRDVWISPRPNAKLQATGLDRAGRRQYLYHPEFRARQEQEKYDELVRFAERLPELREAMSEHMAREPFDPEWTCALAIRLINLGWFRVGTERYARTTRTFGITTLRKSHVSVRGKPDRVSVPRQAPGLGPDCGRRRGARRGDEGARSSCPAAGGSSATSATARSAISPARG